MKAMLALGLAVLLSLEPKGLETDGTGSVLIQVRVLEVLHKLILLFDLFLRVEYLKLVLNGLRR